MAVGSRSRTGCRYGHIHDLVDGAEGYGATKATQINMLEGLRTEVARRGVHVTTVCPGFVRTEMTERKQVPETVLHRGRRRRPDDLRRVGARPHRDRVPAADGGSDEAREVRAGAGVDPAPVPPPLTVTAP